jgi:hypothetical protein
MRALAAIGGAAAAVLALGGCETAFVGDAPRGRYQLVEVNGRALPFVDATVGSCPVTIGSGHFDLDNVARRFEMALDRTGPCAAAAVDAAERGSYLRRGGGLELEAMQPGGTARRLFADESGDTVSMTYDGLRLRFRQAARPPRR